MHPRLRFLLLAALLAVAALALGDGLSPDLAEAQTSRHQFPGLVVDENGRPVERLRVAASVQDGQGRYESRVTTAGGTFRLWLLDGSYRLDIWSGAYRKCTVSGIANPAGRPDAVFPVKGEGVTSIRIVVATSERPEAARWVRCRFDVPFYRVQGTVVGPDQEPLAGIDVRLWGLSSDHNLGPWTGSKTGPDGAFAIEVPAGSYLLRLTAELEDGGDCVLGNYGADGRRASGDVTRIVVTDADVPSVVITLADVPSKLCHEVTGVVTDAESELADGVIFNFSRLLKSGSVTHTATTNAAGTVSLPLLGGTYRLYIWSEKYDRCTVSGIENPEGRPDAVFPVEGEDVTPIRIVVATGERPEAARWVRCRFDVPFYRVQGTVVGPDQELLEGIHVRLYGRSSDHNLGPWTGSKTGPDGTFAIEVPAGSYRLHLRAELEDGGDCVLGNYGADGRRASGDVTRIVVTDADVLGVTLTLADAPSRLCHEIEGVVTDAEGNPLADLAVHFSRVAGSGGESHRGTADATGTFRVRLLEGSYRLFIWSGVYRKCTVSGIENPEGRPDAVFPVEGEGVTPIRIVVATSESVEAARWVACHFDVPFYRVQGTVVGPDQELLEGIHVRLHGRSSDHNQGPWTGEATGPDGTFAIEVPEGSYRLRLTAELEDGGDCVLGNYGADGRRASGDVTRIVVTDADVLGVTLTLADVPSRLCHEVTGVVTDAEGNPLADMSLKFLGHGESQFPTTDEAGIFHLRVRKGSYRVWIRTDLGSDCRIEDYAGVAPGRGNSIGVDGRGVSGVRLVLFGGPRSAITNVKCPYPETITTELEPGWNLAGWTGPETSVREVFEATPPLTTIYSWDGATQSFRWAIRQGSGTSGSLETLEPGMGLWLFVGGTERVNWTRPFLIESAFVSLVEGWNLVSWGGRDEVTADDIVHSLGAGPFVVATWSASRGWFLLSSTAMPAGAHPELQIRRGDALWLQTSEEERWLQPGWPAPDVVLLGDYPAGTEERYRQTVEGAQAFFAERYGVITSEVTFYFAANREVLEDGYRDVRGRSPSATLCANSGSEVIFIATYRCFPVAHEYFHSIQQDLSGNNYLASPTWIVEGSAFYTDFQQRYSRGQASYLPRYLFTWATLGPELTLETSSSLSYGDRARLGYVAFEWLAEEVGEAAIIDYFALLKMSDTWETAFQRAFGLSVDDFYAKFEEHRREVAPPFEWAVTGTILDRDAQPIEGIDIWVIAFVEGQQASNLRTPTGADGSFAIEHTPGAGYALVMAYTCPGGGRHDIGGYGQDGFTTDEGAIPPFTGEERDRRELTITLPVTLAELEREHCA